MWITKTAIKMLNFTDYQYKLNCITRRIVYVCMKEKESWISNIYHQNVDIIFIRKTLLRLKNVILVSYVVVNFTFKNSGMCNNVKKVYKFLTKKAIK